MIYIISCIIVAELSQCVLWPEICDIFDENDAKNERKKRLLRNLTINNKTLQINI